MGKCSNFKRRARDHYPTPLEAVLPLRKYLKSGSRFIEPCAGNGVLIDHLRLLGLECAFAGDILPLRGDIQWFDALDFDAVSALRMTEVDFFISNTPWERIIFHQMIINFASIKPTWLLCDASWPFTKQSAKFMPWCKTIVPIGRVSWMNNGISGFDDCAWYLFDKNNRRGTKLMKRAA